MYDIAMLVFAAIAAIGAVIAALPLLGFDLRIIGRPKVPLDQIEPRARPVRRVWAALVIACMSVLLSAGAFYYFFRPRIVEKIVEKPVEKIVDNTVPCPNAQTSTKVKSPKSNTPTAPVLPVKQDCGGGNCAQSSGQTGGITAGQINLGPPPLELKPSLRIIPTSEGRLIFPPESCSIKTQILITPNQAVPPPIEIALDFDNPVTKIGAVIVGVNASLLGGPFRLGTHALTTIESPGISPHNPLIVEVCSDLPVKLVAAPRLEN